MSVLASNMSEILMINSESPLELYGSSISYFTGKLEMYFRARAIPYTPLPLAGSAASEIAREVGSSQMPALRLADGRWMSDSTEIIRWFEREYPEGGLVPQDPQLRFYSLLLEDFADEWLWRPAMHFRWYYPVGAHYASQYLGEELGAESLMPSWLKRFVVTQRQRRGYTIGDGIGADAVAGVEKIYTDTLACLQTALASRPFLLGTQPSLIDIGFAGPFFRHFGLDPVAADIMRRDGPAVYAWLGRLWDSSSVTSGELMDSFPADLWPLLGAVGRAYIPYLNANADAVRAGKKRFDVEVDGVSYRGARISRYRVWCLQQLRNAFNELDEEAKSSVQVTLNESGIWEPLWSEQDLPMDDQLCAGLPFKVDAKMLEVYK